MVNNIGTTTQLLSIELGRTTTFENHETVTIITGELGNGFLLFDSSGTVGVITNFVDEDNFTVTTYALSIDIENILSLSY